jgi:murein DD-endopeptidase MepM/ murein hydrolase activator NlpD
LTTPFNQTNGTVPTLLNGRMPWPILGPITSGYGWRIHPLFDTPECHTGVDIAASMGAPVDAPAPATVIFAGSLPANGTLVILDHGNGVTTTYSHLSAYRVYVGEHVQLTANGGGRWAVNGSTTSARGAFPARWPPAFARGCFPART